jgi:SAM-dependent methyltransferase
MRIFQPDRVFLGSFVERMAPLFHGRVIDIGGGNRRYANLFTHCTYETMDIDASQHPDHTGSIEKLPFENSTLDGVICTQVLGDVQNPPEAMSEIARVLKSGGKLILTESLFNEEHDLPHDYWRFTEQAYRLLQL